MKQITHTDNLEIINVSFNDNISTIVAINNTLPPKEITKENTNHVLFLDVIGVSAKQEDYGFCERRKYLEGGIKARTALIKRAQDPVNAEKAALIFALIDKATNDFFNFVSDNQSAKFWIEAAKPSFDEFFKKSYQEHANTTA
jgi:hypothetical protein